MKNKYIFILFSLIFLASACSKSPEDIIKDIYSSADKGNYEQILKYVVPDSIELTSSDKEKFAEYMSEKLGETPLYSSFTVESIEPENDGNEMEFTVKTMLNGGESYNEEGLLIKNEKGEWKLALQKSPTDTSSAFSVEDRSVPSRELLRVIRFAYDMAMSDKGLAPNQLRTAYYYYDGVMMPEDKNKYFVLVSSAAKQDYTPAIYELGEAYSYGDGTDKDDKKAFANWEKAANKGYVKAYNSLGVAYGTGIGVPQDYDKAKEWLEKSIAEQDDAQSYYQMALLYNMGAFGKDESHKEIEFLQKAADKGHNIAKTTLGTYYVIGDKSKGLGNKGVDDPEIGFKMISEAAEDGYIPACQMLGMLYSIGEVGGLTKDPAKAFYFYKKGADYPLGKNSTTIEKESKQACIDEVAKCYKNGIGTAESYELYNEYKNKKV